jgi:hypothetical protein
MKRNELTIGAKLAYRSSRYYELEEVTVLAVEPHEDTPQWRAGEPRHRPCRQGNGVLVERISTMSGRRYEDVVQLGHLHGPYAELRAAADEQEKKKNAAKAERARTIKAADDRARNAVAELAEAGIDAKAQRDHYNDIEPRIVLTLDEADKLVGFIKKLDALVTEVDGNVAELIRRVEPHLAPRRIDW